MKELIRSKAKDLGFDACRFTSAQSPEHSSAFKSWLSEGHHGEMAYLQRNAHKRVDPQLVLENAKSIICLATSYAKEESPPDSNPVPTQTANSFSGTIARYARFSDYHEILAERLKSLNLFVDSLGKTKSLWYVDTGPVLERDLAQRAGLGFIGKHTNLISRTLSNWIFLSEIITPLALEPDAPERNRCGTCSRCISACPTGAITEPFKLDARRCISYLTIELKGSIPTEFRSMIGNRIYGCDDCLAVCPWNRFAREGKVMKPFAKRELEAPELTALLNLDDATFKKQFAGSPILRTKRKGFLRNVCVALGNVGDATTLPALHRALSDPEPLVREHAQWAIEQIEMRTGQTTSHEVTQNPKREKST